MSRAIHVPITPSVLAWAIAESGFALDDLAQQLQIGPDVVVQWTNGAAQPTLTAFHDLARVLHRPTATFFLPAPPAPVPRGAISFRHPPGTPARAPLPAERLRIREVARLQSMTAWLSEENGEPVPPLPIGDSTSDPEVVGAELRAWLGVSMTDQHGWKSDAVAFKAWRRAFEQRGVLVFLLPLGADSARGFALSHPSAPAAVVNSHWNPAARIYTLFHEVAHLLTRTDSLCQETVAEAQADSSIERWCERVAAHALLPVADVRSFVGRRAVGLEIVKQIASTFRVSLRAATLQLIELGLARWSLFRSLPSTSDQKSEGGRGDPMKRAELRLHDYGSRVVSTFVRGWRRDAITATDVTRYLDVGDHELGRLEELSL